MASCVAAVGVVMAVASLSFASENLNVNQFSQAAVDVEHVVEGGEQSNHVSSAGPSSSEIPDEDLVDVTEHNLVVSRVCNTVTCWAACKRANHSASRCYNGMCQCRDRKPGRMPHPRAIEEGNANSNNNANTNTNTNTNTNANYNLNYNVNAMMPLVTSWGMPGAAMYAPMSGMVASPYAVPVAGYSPMGGYPLGGSAAWQQGSYSYPYGVYQPAYAAPAAAAPLASLTTASSTTTAASTTSVSAGSSPIGVHGKNEQPPQPPQLQQPPPPLQPLGSAPVSFLSPPHPSARELQQSSQLPPPGSGGWLPPAPPVGLSVLLALQSSTPEAGEAWHAHKTRLSVTTAAARPVQQPTTPAVPLGWPAVIPLIPYGR